MAAWRSLAGAGTVAFPTKVDLPVLGLLQNGWYRDPQRVGEVFARRAELLHVGARRDYLSPPNQGIPECVVGLQKKGSVLEALGQAKTSFPQLLRRR